MSPSPSVRSAFAASLLLLAACGCAQFDPALARREQTETFSASLAALAGTELAKPLSLDDCVRVALRNNYDVRQADLDRELVKIGRDVAFTVFLPSVAVSGGYYSYAKETQGAERRFSDAAVDVGMPVFMPSAWFLYEAARQGYASAGIAAGYVRQSIAMQTTVDYFNVLVQRDLIAAYESQLAAAREAAARARSFAAEGLVAKWEADQALYAAEAREAALNRARRTLVVLRGKLLAGMGLSPSADIRISGDVGAGEPPVGPVDELVVTALSIHPELSIADREVVIREAGVRQAFCAFLPVISLFASGTWTGNDLASHATNWLSGFAGAWTVFDGFANRARHRAAAVELRKTELAREATFLSIMVRVVAAEAALRDAAEAARIRARAYEVAAAKWKDYDAKAREGLLPLTEALDARAQMDAAQAELLGSRYQERIAAANLRLAMGIAGPSGETAGSGGGARQ